MLSKESIFYSPTSFSMRVETFILQKCNTKKPVDKISGIGFTDNWQLVIGNYSLINSCTRFTSFSSSSVSTMGWDK